MAIAVGMSILGLVLFVVAFNMPPTFGDLTSAFR